MSSRNRDKENYSKQYPEIEKWLNECMVCHTIGYKPNLPEQIYPGILAENIRKSYNVLKLNEIGICEDCSKHWKD
mgnify:CR=1 FL=1|jgi:hypothetical protein